MIIIRRLTPYLDLLAVFIWREFTIRYRHSLIGVLWAIVQPLSMMVLFTFIFSYVMKVQVSAYPAALFFYSGLLPWTFFSSSLNYSIPSLTNHFQLITKIYFPREVLPLSGISVALIDLCIASLIFLILLAFFGIAMTWNLLWILPLFLLLLVFTISVSLFLSSLNVYYRDVKLATTFLIQVWFFASPVMYSVDGLDINIKMLLFLNPLTFIIENIRRCILEGRGVVPWQFGIVCALVAVFFVSVYRFFLKTERSFADVI